jgi:hypothetical protein
VMARVRACSQVRTVLGPRLIRRDRRPARYCTTYRRLPQVRYCELTGRSPPVVFHDPPKALVNVWSTHECSFEYIERRRGAVEADQKRFKPLSCQRLPP